MILRFLARSRPDPVPQQLYGAVVTQARKPVFYLSRDFPDTVTGRFDVLALHMFLFSRRLSAEGDPRAPSLSQDVFDAFTGGLDDALRSLGIGDTSVPKRKQAMVRGFYGQIDEFAPLVDAGDEAGARPRNFGKVFTAAANARRRRNWRATCWRPRSPPRTSRTSAAACLPGRILFSAAPQTRPQAG